MCKDPLKKSCELWDVLFIASGNLVKKFICICVTLDKSQDLSDTSDDIMFVIVLFNVKFCVNLAFFGVKYYLCKSKGDDPIRSVMLPM